MKRSRIHFPALMTAMLCLLAGAAVLSATGLPQRAEYTGMILEGQPFAPELNTYAPPFTLTSLTGDSIELFALRGQPVVLNFWATWCEPCEVEMPELQALHERHGDNVSLVGVNLGETPAAITGWLRERALTFTVALDADFAVSRQYALRGQPTTFIISPDGRIVAIFYGPTTQTQLEAALRPYLPSL